MLGVQEKNLDKPKMPDPEILLDIARPVTSKPTKLRPSVSRENVSHSSICYLLIDSRISFNGSMLLLIVVWLHHRYIHRHPNTPFWCG